MRNCLPSPTTSTGLNPSWRNLKFNNIVDPTDNIVWLFVQDLDLTRYPQMSKASFLRHSVFWYCWLILYFVIIYARTSYLFVILQRFACCHFLVLKSYWKNKHICADTCMLHTITYTEWVTKPYNPDDLGVYFLRIHFSLHLTFLFLIHGSYNLFR